MKDLRDLTLDAPEIFHKVCIIDRANFSAHCRRLAGSALIRESRTIPFM
jgi:hypothetical protein